MSAPDISVIMPCHNDGAYLPEAVASLRRAAEENPGLALELIVIDDGSDDEATRAALAQIGFPACRLLRTDHVGPAAARNAGIRAAAGTYILPLDADDAIEPAYLPQALAALAADPGLGIVTCRADFFGAKKGPWEQPAPTLENMLRGNCVFVTSLFRKADWERAGGFAEDFAAGLEDYDFFLSLMETGLKALRLDGVYFHYRIKSVSRSSRLAADPAAAEAAFAKLYQKHAALFAAHMDSLYPALRASELTLGEELSGMMADPVIAWWRTVRALKPKRAARIERLITARMNKDNAK